MMQFLENSILVTHVVLGVLAVIVGAIALFSKKGKVTHIQFGRWFACFMIVSSLLGSAMGLINYSEFLITVFAGILSTTLIASSLLTLRSKNRLNRISEQALGTVNLTNCLAILTAGAVAILNEDGSLFGFLAEDYFFLAGMACVALIGDARYFLTQQILHHRKIARHLWRMCLGFFMAAGSAFTGPGMGVFPQSIKDSGLLSLPELLIFILMIFWLIRILYFSKSKPI